MLSRFTRNLEKAKGRKIDIRHRPPQKNEGNSGDQILVGNILYIKNNNQWFSFSSDQEPSKQSITKLPDYDSDWMTMDAFDTLGTYPTGDVHVKKHMLGTKMLYHQIFAKVTEDQHLNHCTPASSTNVTPEAIYPLSPNTIHNMFTDTNHGGIVVEYTDKNTVTLSSQSTFIFSVDNINTAVNCKVEECELRIFLWKVGA